ncbi:MAG: hypothetical protein IKQ15_04165 [Kiritimatiellae bacterium]|nr:hypothetical protein [Kiritimatiellia bacterium]
MKRFLTQCREDMGWRTQEIALIRKATVLMGASEKIKEVLRRYSVPALYAVWEGFVVTTLSEFSLRVNKSGPLVRRTHCNIVRRDVWERFNLSNLPTDHEKQTRIVSKMCRYFQGRLSLNTTIRTNSNVDYKELSRLMTSLGTEPPDGNKYSGKLAKFLNYRNGIAHGNTKMTVTGDLIKEFSELVTELMEDIVNILDDALKNKLYQGNLSVGAFTD